MSEATATTTASDGARDPGSLAQGPLGPRVHWDPGPGPGSIGTLGPRPRVHWDPGSHGPSGDGDDGGICLGFGLDFHNKSLYLTERGGPKIPENIQNAGFGSKIK